MSDPSLLVLSSLAGADRHGYAIMEDVESFAGLRLGPGTLYGAITRLEERGLICPLPGEDRRRPYRITAEGRRHLETQLAELGKVVRTGLDRLGQES